MSRDFRRLTSRRRGRERRQVGRGRRPPCRGGWRGSASSAQRGRRRLSSVILARGCSPVLWRPSQVGIHFFSLRGRKGAGAVPSLGGRPSGHSFFFLTREKGGQPRPLEAVQVGIHFFLARGKGGMWEKGWNNNKK